MDILDVSKKFRIRCSFGSVQYVAPAVQNLKIESSIGVKFSNKFRMASWVTIYMWGYNLLNSTRPVPPPWRVVALMSIFVNQRITTLRCGLRDYFQGPPTYIDSTPVPSKSPPLASAVMRCLISLSARSTHFSYWLSPPPSTPFFLKQLQSFCLFWRRRSLVENH